MKRHLTWLAWLGALWAVPLGAQRVRGTVTGVDGKPAGDIVIVVSAPGGGVAARALSSATGSFDVAVPAAGTYIVSALRIGFVPAVVSGVVVPATGAVDVPVTLSATTVTLTPVTVRGTDVCGRAAEGEVVRAWTEARTALTAAALWSRVTVDAEWITYSRTMRAGTEAVRQQSVRSARSATTHAFKSWAAESLAARGYVILDDQGATYHAPDPDVLLSDSFADTHCFHLEPAPKGESGLIGVGFRPQRLRGARVDISGTLWIDRANAELRSLDFRYEGLPSPADQASAGGRVEFARLSEGPWIVSRWHIRMPQVGPPEREEKGYQVNIIKEAAVVLRGIGVSGGIVSRVRRRGVTLYTGHGAAIDVRVVSPDTAAPAAAAQLTFAGTDYLWTADSTGRVTAVPVLEGSYTARVLTPAMQRFGVDPIEYQMVVDGRPRLDTVVALGARDIVRAACGADAIKEGLGALHGVVRDSAGRPAAARAVTVSWQGTMASLPDGRVFSGRTTTGTLTDDLGRWMLCGVPRGRTARVHAAGDDGNAATEVQIPEQGWFAAVPLRMSAAVVAGDQTTAILELSAHDKAGQPLADATLELTATTGEQRKVTTDARGRALVASFPVGSMKLRARRVGYTPGDLVVTVAAGRNTVPVKLDKTALPWLDAVRVVGNNRRSVGGFDGFETRRLRKEATATFTQEEIAQRNPAAISDLLRTLGSIRLADSAGVTVAQLTRAFKLDRNANLQACNMRILLDGMVMPENSSVNVVGPREVKGIEVYASTARTPTALASMPGDAACGLIAIWTVQAP